MAIIFLGHHQAKIADFQMFRDRRWVDFATKCVDPMPQPIKVYLEWDGYGHGRPQKKIQGGGAKMCSKDICEGAKQ